LFASTASTQHLAAQTAKWKSLWIDSSHNKQGSTTQLPFVDSLVADDDDPCSDSLWHNKVLQSLPPIWVRQFKGVSKSFKINTTHIDGWHPRQFGDLSDGAISALIELFHACESTGLWPYVQQSLHVLMLPKTDGDRRPILQFRSAFRLWSRIRSSIVKTWFRAQGLAVSQMNNLSGQHVGDEVSRCVVRSGLANCNGQKVIECLWDVSKAFDRVLHPKLVELAAVQNYHLKILRLSILSYTFERRIVVDSIVGEPLIPVRGIGPGSAFAVHELAVVMHPAVVAVRAWPSVILNIHVDDVSLNSTADSIFEARTPLLQAGACVVDIVEKAAGLTFSSEKAQLISNDDELARSTAVLMGIRHGSVESSVRRIGYDYSLKDRGVHLRPSRGFVARQRVRNHFIRFFRLKKLATIDKKPVKLFTAGALPAVLFGAEVWGVSTSFKKKLRVQALQTIGLGVRGTNTAVPWALLRSADDPWLKASWLPFERYHREIWMSDTKFEAAIPLTDLARCCMIARQTKLGPTIRPLSRLRKSVVLSSVLIKLSVSTAQKWSSDPFRPQD